MKAQHSNLLINETSPYLLQHAHNPVNWMPWGDKALKKAKDEQKLLLVSIGYSACHWCHVMEHESFEDEAIAKIMNDRFVCVKVDREERPDVDQVYMEAVQMITGKGGWPLNCFALPDGRPIFGGTYYPKSQWKGLCIEIDSIYRTEPQQMFRQAEAIKKGMAGNEMEIRFSNESLLVANEIKTAFNMLSRQFDYENGGLKGAPKFPMPVLWNSIMTFANYFEDNEILSHVDRTLKKISLGGIYDHVGGGFARYSVDVHWHVPHFEKMLYDQAQLISLYSELYQLTNNNWYRQVIEGTIAFIERELKASVGGFYSALDADSDGEEGKFYVWTKQEVDHILPGRDDVFCDYYSITDHGNWEKGKNILKAEYTVEEYAKSNNLDFIGVNSMLKKGREALLADRKNRIRPGLDDKIITSWNALMIKGLVKAYEALGNEQYLKMAIETAQFVKEELMHNDFSLFRTFPKKRKQINGYLDDYSNTIDAMIELYQATFNEEWILLARELTDYCIINFYDEKSHLFNYTSYDDEVIVTRKKEVMDNVIPASNSVLAQSMVKMASYFGFSDYHQMARFMLRAHSDEIKNHLRYYSNWGKMAVQAVFPLKQVVVTGPNAFNKIKELKKHMIPNTIYALAAKKSELSINRNRFDEEKTVIYVCKNNICKVPVSNVEDAIKELTSN